MYKIVLSLLYVSLIKKKFSHPKDEPTFCVF